MASIKTTSVAEPWPALAPYLLGGKYLGAPMANDWKKEFAEQMMPLLMSPPTQKKKKHQQGDQALLGGGL
ncbi:MAG: hypothetical protein KZQ81_14625 [Candidatus Thiodiazotropha sp. (ex Rostrolucina anterorostrata)]|nr:hypothetical protein [Candidatus Thiodiazotropha sp. (ex Rostrolucina anterorostrata)]